MTQAVDILGNEVKSGDKVAAAFRVANVGQLRVGTVLGFGERGGKPTIKVQWEVDSGYSYGPRESNTLGAIEADLKRFVRL